MRKVDQIEQRLASALRSVLPRAARVTLGADGPVAGLAINGIPVRVKWGGEGWLRQIQAILAEKRSLPDIVVARRMSPGAREMLSRMGIGWLDESGAAEIILPHMVVSRTGQPEVVEKPAARWTGAVFAVTEALLCGTKATVSETQQATGLSSGSCTAALRVLVEFGLLKTQAARGKESARQLVEPDKLLEAYASAASRAKPKASLRVGVTWQDAVAGLSQVGRLWEHSGVSWAATGAAASLVLAPLLTNVNAIEVYVDAATPAALAAVATKAKLRPIEGGRLRLLPYPTVTTRRLATRIGDLQVAPWPRVFADLRTAGVRGEEAAEHLRTVIHGR